ncbi:hypothetical protein DVH24_005496 [Malus domestica]|uniref:Uncharacterized protein n=1 Tax=Malus domestica TaxID=3750 RepID=A0A498KPQ7_MALDO|nr:hypothetical protein DVH24_005496 [Malus domestica]
MFVTDAFDCSVYVSVSSQIDASVAFHNPTTTHLREYPAVMENRKKRKPKGKIILQSCGCSVQFICWRDLEQTLTPACGFISVESPNGFKSETTTQEHPRSQQLSSTKDLQMLR